MQAPSRLLCVPVVGACNAGLPGQEEGTYLFCLEANERKPPGGWRLEMGVRAW